MVIAELGGEHSSTMLNIQTPHSLMNDGTMAGQMANPTPAPSAPKRKKKAKQAKPELNNPP